jgi:PAS domain S-box-containing protein
MKDRRTPPRKRPSPVPRKKTTRASHPQPNNVLRPENWIPLFESSLDLFVITDLKGNLRKLNPRWETLLGVPSSGLLGRNFVDLLPAVHPDDRTATLEAFRVIRPEKPERIIISRIFGGDGTYHWFEWKGFVHGKFVYASAREITEYKQTEEALRESRRMLETILDTIPVRVFWKDLRSEYLGGNRPFARDAGFSSPAELIGRDDYQMGWVEQADLYRADDRTVMDTGVEKIGYEEPQTQADGKRAWVRTSKVPLRDAEGKIRGILGTYEDITEKKNAEQALRESEERYHRITRTITDYIYHVRVDRGKAVETFHGRRCLAVTGYSAEEFAGDPHLWIRMVDPQDRPLVEEQARLALSGQDPPIVEHRLWRKDGIRRWVRNTPVLYRDSHGTLLAYDGLIQDITERKEAELQLHAQHELALALNATTNMEEGLRLCLETAMRVSGMEVGGIYLLNPDTGALDLAVHQNVTPEFASAAGHIGPDDPQYRLIASGKPVYTDYEHLQEFIGPNPLYSQFRSLLGIPILYEHQAIGSLNLASPVKPSIPKPVQEALETLVAQFSNSISRLRTEAALRESEEKYRQLFDSESDAIFLIENPTGRILEANQAAATLYGYKRAALRRMKNVDLSAEPEDTRRVTETTPTAPENIVTVPLRLHRKQDGSVFPVEVTARFFTFQGKPVHIAAVRDISRRRKTEEELRDSRQMLETVLNTIPTRVFWKDRSLVYMGCNRAFARDAGFQSPGEVVGIDDHKIGWREHAEEYRSDDRRVIETGTAKLNYEESVVNAEGRRFWVSTSKIPLRDPEGNIRGVLGTYEDISGKKAAEEEIRALNADLEQRVALRTAQLEAANKELEAFSYSISHDLRAPLRAIDGFTRALEEDYGKNLDAEGNRLCAVVRRNTRQMYELIDDLLAFSRFSRSEMEFMPVDMDAMVRSVFQELTTPESRARIDFRLAPLPTATGDPILLRQVWINLISNAIKFSASRDPARIEVECRSSPAEDVFTIRDNGAGFDMRNADRLFAVFQRLHSATEFEGTGIGLAIVQRVIHRHGGRVWAEGQVDRGSSFSFSLPKTKPEDPPAAD